MTTYQRQTIHSADDVRAVADHAGSHFFDADTMSFWDSRLLDGVRALDGHETVPGARFLFVTSDRLEGRDRPRRYSLRHLTLGTVRNNRPSVDIERLSTYDSADQARKAMGEFAYLEAN